MTEPNATPAPLTMTPAPRKRRLSQRDVLAMYGGLDRSEVSEYQYGKHRAGRVFLYDFGGGYAVALKDGQKMPASLERDFGPWREAPAQFLADWSIMFSGDV